MTETGPSTPRCPACGGHLPPADATDGPASSRWPHYPFCSERCRLLDLHSWLTGAYVIPGRPALPDELDS